MIKKNASAVKKPRRLGHMVASSVQFLFALGVGAYVGYNTAKGTPLSTKELELMVLCTPMVVNTFGGAIQSQLISNKHSGEIVDYIMAQQEERGEYIQTREKIKSTIESPKIARSFAISGGINGAISTALGYGLGYVAGQF